MNRDKETEILMRAGLTAMHILYDATHDSLWYRYIKSAKSWLADEAELSLNEVTERRERCPKQAR